MNPQQEIKSKVTKSDIARSFKEIEKFGGICLNFGDNRKGRKAVTGKPDVEILYKNFYIIEIKVGKDKFSDKQIKYALEFYYLHLTGAYYFVVTENNYLAVKDAILNKHTKQLEQFRVETNNTISKLTGIF